MNYMILILSLFFLSCNKQNNGNLKIKENKEEIKTINMIVLNEDNIIKNQKEISKVFIENFNKKNLSILI